MFNRDDIRSVLYPVLTTHDVPIAISMGLQGLLDSKKSGEILSRRRYAKEHHRVPARILDYAHQKQGIDGHVHAYLTDPNVYFFDHKYGHTPSYDGPIMLKIKKEVLLRAESAYVTLSPITSNYDLDREPLSPEELETIADSDAFHDKFAQQELLGRTKVNHMQIAMKFANEGIWLDEIEEIIVNPTQIDGIHLKDEVRDILWDIAPGIPIRERFTIHRNLYDQLVEAAFRGVYNSFGLAEVGEIMVFHDDWLKKVSRLGQHQQILESFLVNLNEETLQLMLERSYSNKVAHA